MIVDVAERIRELREKHNITQTSLASKLGVSRSCVNAREMGISLPTTDKIATLSKIFHTSTDYILGLSTSELINLEKYNQDEKEMVYKLLSYFDSVHIK